MCIDQFASNVSKRKKKKKKHWGLEGFLDWCQLFKVWHRPNLILYLMSNDRFVFIDIFIHVLFDRDNDRTIYHVFETKLIPLSKVAYNSA